jgi:diguanylate cyclase (GGDEF)-like protein
VASPETDWVRSYVGVPVCIKGEVAGVMNLDSGQPDYFSLAHAERLKAFADQAAIAIENARLYEQAHQLSITDMLTGLYNRRHFFDLAEAELARGCRYGHQAAAIMVDVDHFKEVNDTHGHVVGDAVLAQVAGRLKGQLRVMDILARYGGEEFVVLLPETNLEGAMAMAERLRAHVASTPVAVSDLLITVSISLGVAVSDACAWGLDTWLRHADDALYAAKARGRNQVSIYGGDKSPA